MTHAHNRMFIGPMTESAHVTSLCNLHNELKSKDPFGLARYATESLVLCYCQKYIHLLIQRNPGSWMQYIFRVQHTNSASITYIFEIL